MIIKINNFFLYTSHKGKFLKKKLPQPSSKNSTHSFLIQKALAVKLCQRKSTINIHITKKLHTCEKSSSPPLLLLSSQSDVLPPALRLCLWVEFIIGNSIRLWRFRLILTSTRSYGVRKLTALWRRTFDANTRWSTCVAYWIKSQRYKFC